MSNPSSEGCVVWRRWSAKRFTIRRDRTFPVVHSSTRKGHAMRTRSLVVRCCATVIPLAHLLIVISLFFPYAHYWGTTGWQELFPSPGRLSLDPLDPYYLSLIRDRALVVLIVLALPTFAAVAVFRSPTRMMGLLGVWISLPLTLLSCFVCANIVLDPFNGYTIRSSPAAWFPPLGFALSFTLCLVLALYLPLLRARQQAMSRPVHLEAGQHERAECVSHPNGVELPVHATRLRRRPRLAFLGLLCHLLIGLSLFFPYTELHDQYEGTITPTTGWQMLSEALQIRNIPAVHLGGWQTGTTAALVASLLLAALVLPVLIYLACLLPFPWKNGTADTKLRKSTYLSYLLTTLGFSLSSFVLGLSLFYRGGDLHDPFLTTDLAFVIPPAAFLLSLLCSTALIGYGLWLRPNEPPAFFSLFNRI